MASIGWGGDTGMGFGAPEPGAATSGRSIGERTGGPLQALRVRVGMTKGDKGFRPLNHEPSLSSSGSLCAVGVIPQGTRRVSAGGGRAAAWRKVGSAII